MESLILLRACSVTSSVAAWNMKPKAVTAQLRFSFGWDGWAAPLRPLDQ